MQYIILAYDGTDEKALERRLAAREEHLISVERRAQNGEHLYGAAILDDAGKMIGSMMVVEYATEEALEEWLNEEPYIIGQVWQNIEIKPCKVAATFLDGGLPC